MVSALVIGLLATFACSLLTWRHSVIIAAAVLAGNWAINTGMVGLTDEPYPVSTFLTIDYLSVIVLTVTWLTSARRPRWLLVLIATYFVQITTHIAFANSSRNAWAQYEYWWALYYVAWGQVLLVAAWIACHFTNSNRVGS